MRVYLSGPMTGYPRWNFDAFEDAARRLRGTGLFEVISPHEKDLDDGFDPTTDGSDFDLRAALQWDVDQCLSADGIVLLPGWQDSSGAVIEVIAVEAAGGTVMTLDAALDLAAA